MTSEKLLYLRSCSSLLVFGVLNELPDAQLDQEVLGAEHHIWTCHQDLLSAAGPWGDFRAADTRGFVGSSFFQMQPPQQCRHI